MMPSTYERLKKILIEKFSVAEDAVRPDALLETLGLDSLDLIEVLFEVEEEFNIRVPQDGGSGLRTATVQDIIDSIDRVLAAGDAERAEPRA
jgi:acyl carrier protein